MSFDLIKIDFNGLSDEEKTGICFKAVDSLKEAIRSTTNAYMKTGALLSMIFDNKLYRNHSSDVKTWQQFVADVCPFKVAYADHMRRVYTTFKDSIGDRVIPFNRLLEALPVVNADNMDAVLEDAEKLPRKGWENQVRQKKGKLPTDECTHDDTSPWERCNSCGAWLKV